MHDAARFSREVRQDATCARVEDRPERQSGCAAVMTGPQIPIGPMDTNQLKLLLGEGTERDWLDFKQELDLSSTGGRVEIAKDVGAMSIGGGYIVVGANDDGSPAGLPLTRPEFYDSSRLGPILSKYLSGVQVSGARHKVGAQEYGLICVRPHPDGFAIFASDGSYAKPNGKTEIAFRKGAVYARHNTSSEAWQQADIAQIRRQLAQRGEDLQQARARADEVADELLSSLTRQGHTYLVTALSPSTPGAAPAGQPLIDAASAAEDAAATRAFTTAVAGDPDWTRACYPRAGKGRAVLLSQRDDQPGLEWRAELHRDGSGATAVLLGRREGGAEGWTSVFLDRLEVELANQIDLLLHWVRQAGGSGDVHVAACLYPALDDGPLDQPGDPLPLLIDTEPSVSASGKSEHVHPADAPPLTAAMDTPLHIGAEEPHGPLRVAYALALDLVNAVGITGPTLLRDDGTLDPTFAVIPGPKRRLQERAGQRGVLTAGAHLL